MPGGVLTYLAERGCAALMGRFFYQKSLNMGPVFYQKILKHGSTFLTEPKLLGFGENPENREIFEKWAYFSRKILKNGYPFLPISPLKMGRSFEARAAHPCPTQIWIPPPPGPLCNEIKVEWEFLMLWPNFGVRHLGTTLPVPRSTSLRQVIWQVDLLSWAILINGWKIHVIFQRLQ